MRQIKDIEKMYYELVECRRIFRDFGKDTIIDASRMERSCNRIDKLIGESEEIGHINLDKDHWSS
tara:strand:- start:1081 stop:1275 length:195 start_codon:yes stop_codon:yes gene_type:complete